MRVAISPYVSIKHYRGAEKWAAQVANMLDEDGFEVEVRAIPFAPSGQRLIDASQVLNDRIRYKEAWRHDLSSFDTAYIIYNPLSSLFFNGKTRKIAGIHAWFYVSNRIFGGEYRGFAETSIKILHRTLGKRELSRYDTIHTVTPVFDSPNHNTRWIPNFVDTDKFYSDPREEFTVLFTSGDNPWKGWNKVKKVAEILDDDITIAVTRSRVEGKHVKKLGFLSDSELIDWYARSHVLIYPSRDSTDSMTILEALASGSPVVTSDIKTHVAMFENDEGAILYANTVDEYVSVLRRLKEEWTQKRSMYEERSEKAKELAERRDIDTVYPQLKDMIESPVS
ncbi:MAG: glycosyltransferase family 4 protein [Halobacteria archaeon]|nr:glycosyltransferase family 4 protein [Halobacteria archaeon]